MDLCSHPLGRIHTHRFGRNRPERLRSHRVAILHRNLRRQFRALSSLDDGVLRQERCRHCQRADCRMGKRRIGHHVLPHARDFRLARPAPASDGTYRVAGRLHRSIHPHRRDRGADNNLLSGCAYRQMVNTRL